MGRFSGVCRNRATPLKTAILAIHAIKTARIKKSSTRKTTPASGVAPISSSGERSIEKIRIERPKFVFTKVIRQRTRLANQVTFNADASGEDLTSPSTIYENDGEGRIALRVRDGDGGVSPILTSTVTVNNVPPTANPGVSYAGDEGSPINFNASATDPGSDTLTYEWDFTFGGGQFSIDQSGNGLTAPEHIYVDDGEYVVALRVRDDDSLSSVVTAFVTVANVQPTANAGGPYQGEVGSQVTFSGSASDPGNDPLTYEWDFEYNGTTFDTIGTAVDSGVNLVTPTHVYSGEGTFTVALRVSDDDDISAIVTAQVTVLGTSVSTPTPTPTFAPTPQIIQSSGGGGGAVKKKPTATPEPTATLVPTATHTAQPTATPKPLPTPQLRSRVQTATIDTRIQTDEQGVTALEKALTTVLGGDSDVKVTDSEIDLVTTDGGFILKTSLTGVSDFRNIRGDLSLVFGNVSLETTDGNGTASIELGDGLSVRANAILSVTDDAFKVVMEDVRLLLLAEAPDVADLVGGSDNVTEIGAEFDMGLTRLPDGASLSVQFARDVSAIVDDSDERVRQAASKVGGSIANVAADVAFAVSVNKIGITNSDLGDNSVSLTVSKAWHDQMVAQGKQIVISKIADEGDVFSSLATCALSDDTAICAAEFVGEASGFSSFVLMAVTGASQPSPTPTYTQVPPTATPSRPLTPTHTATPTLPRVIATATSTRQPTRTPTPTSTQVPPTPTHTPTPGVVSQPIELPLTPTPVPPTASPSPTPMLVAQAISEIQPPGSTTTNKASGAGFTVPAFAGILAGIVVVAIGVIAYLWRYRFQRG